MKKKILGLCVLAVIGCLAGCGKKDTAYVDGVYLTYGEQEELYVFSDEDTDTLFLAEIPDDIVYDQEGKKQTREILNHGDTVRIYHDGKVLESMPPKYANVTRVELEEKAEDLGEKEKEKYEKQIASFYKEPDETEIPMLAVETELEGGVSAVKVSPVSYRWGYEDEEGKTHFTASSPIKDPDLPLVACAAETGSVQLYFSRNPEEVKVSQCKKKGTVELDVEKTETGYRVADLKAGKTYQIEGNWGKNCAVTYKFTLTKIEKNA